jgi:dienelactone hydrolase
MVARIAVLSLLTAGLAAGCGGAVPPGAAADPDTVEIPPISVPRARMSPGPIPAVYRIPEGEGPFPAVIVLHGCGGRGASQLIWARRLNGWGYAVLIPDSMTPRGVKRVCEPDRQPFVTPRDRVGDVASAAAWLRTRKEIDPARIAVLGQSHGGATAAMATERIYAGFGLRAAIDYYGSCINGWDHGAVPLLVLAGEEDDWGHPALRCRAYGMALHDGQAFEIHTYPGVYHAFENPAVTRMVSNHHIMEYDHDAAEDSYLRVRAFLKHWVKG